MARFNNSRPGPKRGKSFGSSENRSGAGRPGASRAGKSGSRPGGKPGSRPGGSPDNRFGSKSGQRPRRPGDIPARGRAGRSGRPQHSRRPPSDIPANQEGMIYMLEKSGIKLTSKQYDQLWKYHNLLRKRNVDNELTRITGFEPMVIKHYVDCLIVGDLIDLPSPIVDVGSGPGFPGIPLKIRYPNLKMVLAEPRPTRIEFLNEVWRGLGMSNVTVFEHKVVSRSFKEPVNAVITRAVEVMEKTILRTSACLQKGGKIIFMKGPNCDEEIKVVQKRFGDSYRLVMDKAYNLPHTQHARRLVVWERLSEPAVVSAPSAEEESYSPEGEQDLE